MSVHVFCFFSTVELVSLEENISFIRSFCCHVVKKKGNVQSRIYPGGSLSSRVKSTRDVCFGGGGGEGHLGAIPSARGN